MNMETISQYKRPRLTKISVLFKPADRSWITWPLRKDWMFEIWYTRINDEILKSHKRIMITWVPFDEIDRLYDKALYTEGSTVLICSAISRLFEE